MPLSVLLWSIQNIQSTRLDVLSVEQRTILAMLSGLTSLISLGASQDTDARELQLRASRVYHLDAMAAHQGANGTESRNVVRGQLATGEWVGVHESVQPRNAEPVALHRIGHTEIICVREGTVEFEHDGRKERASAGDILFVGRGTEHRVVNVGGGPAAYFVVAIGGDVQR